MQFIPHYSGSSGNLYEVVHPDGKGRLAIDPGVPINDARRALEFGVSDLDGVLVSHHHGDHCCSASDFARSGVGVYGSTETLRHAQVEATTPHRAHALEPLRSIRIGHGQRWRVLPFDTVHDAEGAMGFVIADAEAKERLLYAIDTAYLPYRFADLTVIAIEANFSSGILRDSSAHNARKRRVLRHHMSVERVCEFLHANDLSKLREVHLLHLSSEHSDADKFREMVSRSAGVPVYVAPRRPR